MFSLVVVRVADVREEGGGVAVLYVTSAVTCMSTIRVYVVDVMPLTAMPAYVQRARFFASRASPLPIDTSDLLHVMTVNQRVNLPTAVVIVFQVAGLRTLSCPSRLVCCCADLIIHLRFEVL